MDMEETMRRVDEEMKFQRMFIPRTAIETRSSTSFAAEVILGGKHHIVGVFSRMQDAQACADKWIASVKNAMMAAGEAALASFPVAKE